MPICRCSKIPHSKYTVRSLLDKNRGFNDHVTRLSKNHSFAQALVLDAAGLHTSKALLKNGACKITAVNCCVHEIKHMRREKLTGVKTWHGDIEQKYAKCSLKSVLVIDDGMQSARKTIPRIKTLLNRGPQHLTCMFNIAPRDGQYSHRTFATRMLMFARRAGYKSVNCQSLKSYKQGKRGANMWPYWFEFTK